MNVIFRKATEDEFCALADIIPKNIEKRSAYYRKRYRAICNRDIIILISAVFFGGRKRSKY